MVWCQYRYLVHGLRDMHSSYRGQFCKSDTITASKEGIGCNKKVLKASCPTKVETGPVIKSGLPKPPVCTINVVAEVDYPAKFLLLYKSTGSVKKTASCSY
jgi:hypothetical protein